MRKVQRIAVRRVVLPLRRQFLDELDGSAPRPRLRSPLDYRLEALERRIVWAAGELDPSFGAGGTAFVPGDANDGSAILDIAPDGSLLVGTTDAYRRWSALYRYDAEGQLDTDFGVDGKVETDITPSTDDWIGPEELTDVAVLSDGKIVVLGNYVIGAGAPAQTTVLCYNADGTLDQSFGDGGRIIFAGSGWPAMLARPGGGFLVVGQGGAHSADGLVYAFNADGSPDLAFGDQGRVQLDFGQNEEIRGETITPDGTIVLALTNQDAPNGYHVVRLSSDGQLDETFGDGGKVFVSRAGHRVFSDVVRVMDDGRIVVSGFLFDQTSAAPRLQVTRLLPDGSLDPSFGDGGTATADDGNLAQWMDVQADGKVVMGANRYNPAAETYDTILFRLTADGRPDESFGPGGLVVHDLHPDYESVVQLEVTTAGDILTAGLVGTAPAVTQFDAGELWLTPPAPPAPPANEGPGAGEAPTETPPPPQPPRERFNDVRPVGDVEDEPGRSFRAWSDDLLDPETDEDEEELLARL